MGFRLQRSIRLGKFVRLNISKSGVGFSAGITGLRISKGPSGTWFTIGLPGTGLSYRKKLDSKSNRRAARSESQTATETAALPEPGFFAPGHEKDLAKGLAAYRAGHLDEALEHLLEAAPDEPGAAILAASLLVKDDTRHFEGTELLENVVESDDEFPTPLMEKYLAGLEIDIDITPNITASVAVDGLAAILLLVELYQKQRRVREAIALLEEVEALAQEPAIKLSLCELYASRNLWDNIIDVGKKIESEDDVTLGIMIFYGRALQEKELHEAAITIFTKALRRRKDRTPALLHKARYWRAISYQTQGKNSRANKEFQKLYAEAPDFRDVAERLAEFSLKP